MLYAIRYGDQFLKDMGRWHTQWVTNLTDCMKFEVRSRAEIFALTVGGEVVEVNDAGTL